MENSHEDQCLKKPGNLDIPDQSLGNGGVLRVPRKNRDLERTQQGCLIMNERNLRIICETDGLYEFPELNKKIYLHYKVIDRIYGLDKYINLRSLYLENNVIRKIENLDRLEHLENLFLQNNMIKTMEGLSKLKELKVLNLANNNIFVVDGLADCLLLQSLTLHHNYLSDLPSLEHLGQCSSTLTSIDLSDNQIVPDQRMFNLIPQVKLLYLAGNPLVRQTNHYRRTVVAKLPALMYLDQRAVDSQERMLAESWLKQGEAGYKTAKSKIATLRRQRRQEAREEIMATIDVHRKKKINVFEGNILDSQKQIEKLKTYMRQPGNQNQIYFYENRIAQLMQKIKQNQDFIDAIYKRMGIQPLPPVYSIELEIKQKEEEAKNEMREGGMFEIEEEPQGAPSEGQSQTQSESASIESGQTEGASVESGTSGRQQSSSSQPSSLQTYYSYDELD